MVTVNLWWMLAIASVAMLACGYIGLRAGARIGYYEGFLAAMNNDAICGLRSAAIAAQRKEGEK